MRLTENFTALLQSPPAFQVLKLAKFSISTFSLQNKPCPMLTTKGAKFVTGFLNEDNPFWLGKELIKLSRFSALGVVTAQTADAIPVICLVSLSVCLSVMHTHCSDCHRAQITLFLTSFTASDLRYWFRFRNGRVGIYAGIQ